MLWFSGSVVAVYGSFGSLKALRIHYLSLVWPFFWWPRWEGASARQRLEPLRLLLQRVLKVNPVLLCDVFRLSCRRVLHFPKQDSEDVSEPDDSEHGSTD